VSDTADTPSEAGGTPGEVRAGDSREARQKSGTQPENRVGTGTLAEEAGTTLGAHQAGVPGGQSGTTNETEKMRPVVGPGWKGD
jgi:hypothetical protein